LAPRQEGYGAVCVSTAAATRGWARRGSSAPTPSRTPGWRRGSFRECLRVAHREERVGCEPGSAGTPRRSTKSP